MKRRLVTLSEHLNWPGTEHVIAETVAQWNIPNGLHKFVDKILVNVKFTIHLE